MFKRINSFYEVELKSNALIMIDIDDTIMKYETLGKMWWRNTFDKYYEKHGDYDLADKNTLDEWRTRINEENPVYVDKSGLFDLFERAQKMKSKIILLTARCENLKEITIDHLNRLEIYFEEIYFSSNVEKGIVLKKLKKDVYQEYEHVICIDDHLPNLESIFNKFEGNVECYQMC